MPYSRGSSLPKDLICASWDSCIAGGFFIAESLRKPIHTSIYAFISQQLDIYYHREYSLQPKYKAPNNLTQSLWVFNVPNSSDCLFKQFSIADFIKWVFCLCFLSIHTLAFQSHTLSQILLTCMHTSEAVLLNSKGHDQGQKSKCLTVMFYPKLWQSLQIVVLSLFTCVFTCLLLNYIRFFFCSQDGNQNPESSV